MVEWFVYILNLSNGAFYTGITNDIERRMNSHKHGKGSKCVRAFLPFKLIYLEKVCDKSKALRREMEIKKFTKIEKKNLLSIGANLIYDDRYKKMDLAWIKPYLDFI